MRVYTLEEKPQNNGRRKQGGKKRITIDTIANVKVRVKTCGQDVEEVKVT